MISKDDYRLKKLLKLLIDETSNGNLEWYVSKGDANDLAERACLYYKEIDFELRLQRRFDPAYHVSKDDRPCVIYLTIGTDKFSWQVETKLFFDDSASLGHRDQMLWDLYGAVMAARRTKRDQAEQEMFLKVFGEDKEKINERK